MAGATFSAPSGPGLVAKFGRVYLADYGWLDGYTGFDRVEDEATELVLDMWLDDRTDLVPPAPVLS